MANKTKSKAKKRNGRSGGLNTTYLTKMGMHNLVANRSMSLSSISVLTACLLLIGVSFLLLFNIQNLVKDVENQNVVVAFAKDKITKEELGQMDADLKSIVNVTDVEFVSKEQAYKEQLAEIGVEEDAFDGIISNPLPNSFRISVSNIDEFNETLALIKSVKNVDTVRESQEIVNQISTLQVSITAICLIIVVVLVVVSLFIIGNTIRITMVNRKIDIQVMKSVGATNTFICWPFMIEGIFIGLISGLLSLGLTFLFQATQGDSLNSLFGLFGSQTVSAGEIFPNLIVGYIVAGVLLGSSASVVSIRKYLKKEGSEANEI